MFSRPAVIQRFLDLQEASSYLEIGVNEGETFEVITAKRKVAVDPKFLFRPQNSAIDGKLTEFHEVTSDKYFGEIVSPYDRFDVIYLDGLHVAEQTLRDLLNAVMFIKPHGIIIIDDVVPSSYTASLPLIHDFTVVRNKMVEINPDIPAERSWMGDVFKIPFFVDTFLQQFTFATVKENHGQTVIWRKPRAQVKERPLETVARLDFKDLVLQMASMNVRPLDEIVSQVREDHL